MKKISKTAFGIVFCLMGIVGSLALNAAGSPWEMWRNAYTSFEKGVQFYEKGDYVKASAAFVEAERCYLSVKRARPDWNQKIINERIDECRKEIAKMRSLLGTESKAQIKPVVTTTVVANSGEIAFLKKSLADKTAENRRLAKENQRISQLERSVAGLIRELRVANEELALAKQNNERLKQELKRPDTRKNELEEQLVKEKIRNSELRKKLVEVGEKLRESVLKEARSATALRLYEKNNQSGDDKLRRQEQELGKLRDINRRLNYENTEVSGAKKQLEKQLSDCRDQIARLEKERGELAEKLRQGLSKSTDKAVANKALTEENRQLFEKKNELQKELVEAREKVAELKRQCENQTGKAKEFEESLLRTENKRRFLEQEVANVQGKLTKLQIDFEATSKELASGKQQIAKLGSEVVSLVEQRNKLLQENRMLTERYDKLQRQNQDSDDSTGAKLVRSEKSAAENLRKVGDLQLEVKYLKEQVTKLDAENKRIVAENERVSDELQKTIRINDSLQKTVADYQTLQKNFTALQRENQENRVALQATKPREADISNIKLRLAELNELKSKLATEEQLNSEMSATLQRVQRQLKQAQNAEKELMRLKRELPDVNNLRNEVTQLKAINADLTKRLVAQENISNLQLNLVTAESKAARLVALEKRNAELTAMQIALTAEVANLRSQIIALQAKTSANGEKNANSGETLLKNKVDELLKRLSVVEEKLIVAQNQLALFDSLKVENEKLRKLADELADAKKFEAEVAKLRSQLNDFQYIANEKKRLEKHLKELSEEYERLQKELLEASSNTALPVEKFESDIKESADELVASGALAETNENMELAIWYYRRALQVNPEYPEAAKRLGVIYFARYNWQEAARLLEVVYNGNKEDIDAAYYAAIAEIEQKKFGRARAIVEPILRKQRDNWRLQLALARIETGIGKFAEAEKRLQFASRLAPNQSEITVALARVLIYQGSTRQQEALNYYEKARKQGAQLDLEIEKALGAMITQKRDIEAFLSDAAAEAENAADWSSAVWYYRQLVEQQINVSVWGPRLAFVLAMSGQNGAATEALHFAAGAEGKGSILLAEVIKMWLKYRGGELAAAEQVAVELLKRNNNSPVEIPETWLALQKELKKTFSGKNSEVARKCLQAVLLP